MAKVAKGSVRFSEKTLDLIGQRFGRLTITEIYRIKKSKKVQAYTGAECLCDCGQVKVTALNDIKKGDVKSCGCLQKELISEKMKEKHKAGDFDFFKKYANDEEREAAKELRKQEHKKRLAVLQKKKQLLKRLAKLQEEKDWRRKNFAIRYYTPHQKQDAFHRDKARIRIVLGANRSGKTQSSTNETVAHCLGYRPWLKEDDPDYKVDVRIPGKILVIGESFGEQVKKVLVPKFLGDIEKGVPGAIPVNELAATKKNQQGIVVFIKFKNGSTIDFQSYDQDVDLFESSDYDIVYYDEPPPRPIWIASQRGLTDRMGRCWLAMTPLKEPWIYDELVCRDDVGKYTFDIQDNVGYGLTQPGVDEFAKTLTDDEKEARLRGRFFHLSGLVYKLYGDINRIGRVPIERHWGVWFHVDTHPRTPHHAIWVAVLPDGKRFVCGELKNSDPSNLVEPFVEAVKIYESEILRRRGDEIVRLIEPGSSTPNPTKDGLSIKDEFEAHGIFCRPGSKNRDAGILLLQNELQYNPEKGTYPNIYFFDDLEGIHKEMTHYVWSDWAQKVAFGRTEKQVPKDKDDHWIEGLHRILLDDPACQGYDYDHESEPVEVSSTGNQWTGY